MTRTNEVHNGMDTIKTRLHAYNFDISKPDERAAYEALRAQMATQGTRCFETYGQGSHYMPELDGPVELETEHLFADQWNTAPIAGVSDKGYRVFDWAQDYMPQGMNQKLKRGHYLEQTAEMIEARASRRACGYCGAQYQASEAPKFCSKCIGGEYLKSTELHLLRVQGIGRDKRTPLSPEEHAELLPVYEAAQRGEGNERAAKARAEYSRRIEERHAATISEAETEYQAQKWLLAAGARMSVLTNVIYYRHKDLFTFGWSKPVDGDDLDWLLANLSEFPFEYSIKTKDRGELGGRE